MLGNNKHNIYGASSEIIAVKYLQNLSYYIIDQNYHTQYGEIDIIANIGNRVVFIEVKARNNISDYELISNSKQKKCCNAAQLFLSKYPDYNDFDLRFDLIHIVGSRVHQHLEGAWEC